MASAGRDLSASFVRPGSARYLANRRVNIVAQEAFARGFDMTFILGSGDEHLVTVQAWSCGGARENLHVTRQLVS